MKGVIIIALLFCSGFFAFGQDIQDTNTNGLSEYWNPDTTELFLIFRKKYWDAKKINHLYETKQNTLLVRLVSDDKRISLLEEKGKTKAAQKLRDKATQMNEEIVRSFNDNYDHDIYYYYPKDAEAILQYHDLSKLYINTTDSAENVVIENMAYILLYSQVPGTRIKKFNLNIWNKKTISRLRNNSYLAYESTFSTKKDIYKSIATFCQDVNESLASN